MALIDPFMPNAVVPGLIPPFNGPWPAGGPAQRGCLWLRETNFGRQGDEGLDERRYTRSFQVLMAWDHNAARNVLAAIDPNTGATLPQIGDHYQTPAEEDIAAFCFRRTPRPFAPQDNHRLWEVIVEYSTEAEPSPVGQYEVSWTTEKYVEPFTVDHLGVAVLNSAGCPFEPPPVRERFYKVLRHRRNEGTFDHREIEKYRNKWNSTPFLANQPAGFAGYPTGYAFCSGYEAVHRNWAGGDYWEVSREWRFKDPDYKPEFLSTGWRYARYLNAGQRALRTAGGLPEEIRDARGERLSRPGLLNADGTYTAALQSAASANYLSFQPYTSEDFNVLNILIY